MPHLSKADKAAKVSVTEAQRRKEVALAKTREIELAQLEGKLVPKAEVTRFWAGRCGAIRDSFLSMPDRLAARLAGKHEAEIRVALRDEIEEALRSLHAEAQR